MKLGFIGAGKVGIAMGHFFRNNDIELAGYYSRTFTSSQNAAKQTNSKPYQQLDSLINKVDTIAITTSDDQIEYVIKDMLQLDCDWNGKNIFHMSGAKSSLVLEPLLEKGATVFSLHPMMTIQATTTVTDLIAAYFTFEGKGKNIFVFENHLQEWGLNWLKINPEDKQIYHAAAVIASNYLITVIDLGIELFKQIGIEEEEAKALVKPLAEKSINNIWEYGTKRALTGPIARGDLDTIELHLEALSSKPAEWDRLYRILGLQTLNLARRGTSLKQDSYRRIKEVLEND